MSYPPIENHGIVGDLHTAALVCMDGTVDFLCFPRFDSPSIFASLLDDEKGGRFELAPALNGARKQLYLPDSNILLTRFLADDGVAEISDFMPVEAASCAAHNLIRRAKTVRGKCQYHMVCAPRFNYGRTPHRVERISDKEVHFIPEGDGQPGLRLICSIPVEDDGVDARAAFTLGTTESARFVLEEIGGKASADRGYVADNFKRTLNFWRSWIGRCHYTGRWREMVHRSALTLKLLVVEPFGSLVASPTFSLPECVGGTRNWDYRYVWIRDASFTLYGLIRLGYTEEAGAFMKWIEDRCRELKPDGSLQIMYGVDGRHDIGESTLEHFEGYRGSQPVRIGNGAYDQLQLDIHGELMDSVYLYDKYGEPISHQLWLDLTRLIDWVCGHWCEADEGIWEVRGGRQQFLYSRLMCWVAIDRGIRLARKRSFPAPLARWLEVRDAIYEDIHNNFWDPKQECFVQHLGSETVDAACLLMPLVKFISPTDPRWLSTLAKVEEKLVEDSLVHRYRTANAAPDGLKGTEGTFSMCTFWFAECLARAGDPQKARFIFEKMLGYANHLGLYAEQLGARGEHLGNFPQAFTHLGLISAAYAIDRALDPGR